MVDVNVSVTGVGYAGKDRFLFFSRPEDVLEDISEWLSQGEAE